MTWDNYFLGICNSVAEKSPCLSRKIGAILVRNNLIIATGYNGPPSGVAHCEKFCPRKQMGFKSGEGLEFCPAVHAEMNAVINAAVKGVCTLDTTLYMNSVTPCKTCMGILMNAGVKDIVISQLIPYDDILTKKLQTSHLYPSIREFKL